MTPMNQYCTFRIDADFFGVDVKAVQEVIRFQTMTCVPKAASEVAGLINLRGQIVTAIDMRRRLSLRDREPGQKPMNVVVRTTDGTVSLLVDEIGEVLTTEPDSFEPPPETLKEPVRSLLDGVFKLKNGLLLIMNIERAVNVA